MKTRIACSIYLLPVLFFCFASCSESEEDSTYLKFQIENLSIENYPKVNGSTSTEPLQCLIACKLFGIDYAWVYLPYFMSYPHHIMPASDEEPEVAEFITNHIRHWGTHRSFEQLITKNADLILVARTASDDETHLADSLNVSLIQTPVALDAFVFLVNHHNPVSGLTTQQIQDIYTGKIKNWNEVGGSNAEIHPFQRNENSGSQELMQSLVMKDLTMPALPDMIIHGMMGLINRIEFEPHGLGYSVNYYTQYMIRSDSIRIIAVDGTYPQFNTLKNQNYTYTTEVYVVIREDLEKSAIAYQLYELLLTSAGKSVIGESGYIPY